MASTLSVLRSTLVFQPHHSHSSRSSRAELGSVYSEKVAPLRRNLYTKQNTLLTFFFSTFLLNDPNSEATGLHLLQQARAATASAWKLRLIQLQANELLHALPVLHLGGAVSVILT